ncbi:MAG TPA: twin-arginine translocase subunit TatC [Gemmatimonadaceae bacterium]|nr:twin-arginine translocase subunit TatC [Gemmatimonadaceae bacterium]
MTRQQSDEMPFLDHLEELRWRIIWSLLALVVAVGVGFVVMLKVNIIGLLARPIIPYLAGQGGKLVYTHPGDPFTVVLTASVALGVVLALPVILYQLWAFVAPALYREERRLVIPVLFFAMLLFLAGIALAYFVVLPLAIPWLMGFQVQALAPMITVHDYFDFAVSMAIAFGLAFELPIVVLVLATLGVVTPQFLNHYRRHAVLLCVIVGAFLTPGDLVWTTILMSVPLYLLYEISVALTYMVYRRRERRAARDAASTGSEATA